MSLLAQKHDYTWMVGLSLSDNPLDSNWGTTVIDFGSLSNPKFFYDGNGVMDFDITDANISDASGKYLFSYNGAYIEDAQSLVMPNSLNLSDSGNEIGDVLPQGGLLLPMPESSSKYILIHESVKWFLGFGAAGYKVHYSIIDMEKNGEYGQVTDKRNLLVVDTLDGGKLTATKHANGRDWWVLIPKERSNIFYRLLVTPSAVMVDTIQVDLMLQDGLGQALFSPDGTKYVSFSGVNAIDGDFLYIYDFDRCTGRLNNSQKANYPSNGWGGVSISPNSKILYLQQWNEIYQLDLTASNIFDSKNLIAETDNYLDAVYFPAMDTTYFYGHAFFLGQLAPNGKIYISATGTTNKLMHIIHNPNVWGEGCNVEQHVRMPTFNRTVPNFPNYRLGPIDGSVCDSLGINNVPLARFRYDQDTMDSMSFDFIDLSNYEPDTWHWDFGDGTTSQDTSPTHVYAGVGVYPVCLTVSNQYGSSTMCDTLYLSLVDTQGVDMQSNVRVWPNPFTDNLILSLDGFYPQKAYIYFYDVMGRFLWKKRVRHGVNELDVSGFMTGMIFYEVRDGDLVIGRGKLVGE